MNSITLYYSFNTTILYSNINRFSYCFYFINTRSIFICYALQIIIIMIIIPE